MKTNALTLLLYCFCVLFTPCGHGADLPERKAVQDINKTLQMIVDSEAGSRQLSDSINTLRLQFAHLDRDSQIEAGDTNRFLFRALPIRGCSKEERDGINQSLFRALPKIIGQLKGGAESAAADAYMLLISVQADCLARETAVWTKWLASKASYREVLWAWALTQPMKP